MNNLLRLGLVLLFVLPTAACVERQVDLTDSAGFAALKGLCLQCKEGMVAAPMGDSGFDLIPVSAVPRGMEVGHGYIAVPLGSRFVIDEILFVRSFEGSYLFICAQLYLQDEHAMQVGVEAVFSWDWRKGVVRELREGTTVRVDPAELPIEWRYVSRCVVPCKNSIRGSEGPENDD